MQIQDERIPVTLLTGFLGAGKTTLLNRLLSDPDAGRIAVIMNEFGDVGLDHDLIEEVTEDTILMHAGCLCCSIRGDLAKTMILLLSRLKRGELSFDRIVIETTGIADPGPIMNTIVTDPMIAPNFRTDGVVTLADAATGPTTLDRQAEAVRQIAMADLIVMTKTDLVSAEERALFETRLEGINRTARRMIGEHGDVPIHALFGLSAMHKGATPEEMAAWLGARAAQMPKRIEHQIQAASIEIEEPIPSSVFDHWLEALMALKGPDVLRFKAIVHVEGVAMPYVFHGVGHIFERPMLLTSWSGKNTKSRIVVIARDIDKQDLKASLETLVQQRKEQIEESLAVDTSGMPF
ncbi:MAG: GTP-binding protein [Pseudomonadota bacterium]